MKKCESCLSLTLFLKTHLTKKYTCKIEQIENVLCQIATNICSLPTVPCVFPEKKMNTKYYLGLCRRPQIQDEPI